MTVDVIVAIISASAVVAVATFTFLMQRKLEVIKAAPTEVQEERKARRDYEYEARKRLYGELQPLLFQLRELSEGAYRWVITLARTARKGQLSWLSKGYFLTMTLYRFTAPLAFFDWSIDASQSSTFRSISSSAFSTTLPSRYTYLLVMGFR